MLLGTFSQPTSFRSIFILGEVPQETNLTSNLFLEIRAKSRPTTSSNLVPVVNTLANKVLLKTFPTGSVLRPYNLFQKWTRNRPQCSPRRTGVVTGTKIIIAAHASPRLASSFPSPLSLLLSPLLSLPSSLLHLLMPSHLYANTAGPSREKLY
jgi:hypothetical protein